MADYEYDVFLSYRRANDWPRFVRDHFLPKFKHWLDTTLGRSSSVFFDAQDIEAGESWPYRLADALAHSRIMVCLWSKEYFSSRWCAAELSHMLARRQSLTNSLGPPPLILAIVIHDGDDIDTSLADIQRFPLQKYSNPWIAEGSSVAEVLSMRIQEFSGHVVHALNRVPDYDPSWPDLATKEFLGVFANRTVQRELPSLGPTAS